MSGGSYNYLCFKVAGEFGPDDSNLLAMIARLEDIGYAQAAHTKTVQVQTKLREVEALLADLTKVWYAVEWRDSCDWGEDQLRAELIRYEAAHLDTSG